jgi:hypothetical protein
MHFRGNVQENLQFIAVLPDIIETNNVRMIEQLHDADLALKAEWNDLAVGIERPILLSALDQIGQAQRPHFLGRGLGDDLGRAILTGPAVAHKSNARTSTASDGLAQLPRTNICLASATAGGVGARVRDLRVAFGITWAGLVGDNDRKTLILGRGLLFMASGECTIGY